jgi:multidrug efflux system membrane fusion protein
MTHPEFPEEPVRRRRRSSIGLLAFALTVAGAGLLWLRHDDQTVAAMPPVVPAIPVHVETATQTDVPIFVSGLGTVQAFNTVTLKTQVDGTLQDVRFHEGQSPLPYGEV